MGALWADKNTMEALLPPENYAANEGRSAPIVPGSRPELLGTGDSRVHELRTLELPETCLIEMGRPLARPTDNSLSIIPMSG